ncbi:potassium channel family protein [Streptomyces sp. NBC_01408]|uniref:potassium channel family protein n=1 Tax=Streptomyces sp. NBC_01408 TaxID=2903855 RepID=UPI002251BDD5|nr:potassium channel family protein [Streptomyces sp. NBC_01408]MCX4693480.1 potassium channel family protein [Streptomyces sp. NBC_01408]
MDRNSGGHRRQVVLACVRSLLTATLLVAAYYLLPMDSAFTPATALALVGGIAAVTVLMGWQIYRITLSPRPGLKAMEAMTITVPLFILLYATACFLMEHSAPGSFSEPLSRTDALYFAMTVFSTVGFGDITARSEPARLLTTGQITLNLLLLGVAARLLANAVQRGRERRDQSPGPGGGGSAPPAP